MRPRPRPIAPGAGQESVWDYPRPPRVEPMTARLRVEFASTTIADTARGFRVLETSHPPNYYIPADDIVPGVLVAAPGSSMCEWKGAAQYFDVRVGDRVAHRAAWSYPDPVDAYRMLAGAVAFYPGLMDACWVGDELAVPQPGAFYGGWITTAIVGPFKGEPDTMGW